MIKLGLRSSANTISSQVYQFGNLKVVVSQIEVANLDKDGLAYHAIQRARVDGEVFTHVTDGAFKHQYNTKVDNGSILDVEVIEPPFGGAETKQFCNTTARYKFGIPVYHYNVGLLYPSTEPTLLTEHRKQGALYEAAKTEAQKRGVTDFSSAQSYDPALFEFLEEGLTLNWEFCDSYTFPELR
ncbi:hypothetical protein [Actibacterium lipolyticum]|nr:hypothetical protein [Actibacterium lipolyticum]